VTYSYRVRTGSSQWGFPPFSGAVRGLIIACVAVYVVQMALAVIGPGSDAEPGLERLFVSLFGLVPWNVLHGWIWQPVTYLFLHGDPFHILFNMLALWMFGTTLEQDWGSRAFLKYYFLTGIGAGVLTFAVSIHSRTPTIGASGAIYGLLLAYALYFPDRPIYMYFVFPIPAKIFVAIMGAIAFFSSLGEAGGVANATHLGGLLVGYLYLKGARMHPL
jgi:membrane associated rhomboid family serine protease